MKNLKNKKQILSAFTAVCLIAAITAFPSFSVEIEDGTTVEEIATDTGSETAHENTEGTGIEEPAAPNGNLDEAGAAESEENETDTATEAEGPESSVSNGTVSVDCAITEDELVNRNFGYIPEDTSHYNFDSDDDLTFRGSNPGASFEDYYVSFSDSKYEDGTPVLPADLLPDDQMKTGICWVYSSNKAVEFAIKKAGGDVTNLSEKNTAYYFWNKVPEGSEGNALADAFNTLSLAPGTTTNIAPTRERYGAGGNSGFLDLYYTAWKGLVPQTGDDAFTDQIATSAGVYDSNYEMSAPDISKVYSRSVGHITDVPIVEVQNVDEVKQAVKEYGAVTYGVGTWGCSANNAKPAWFYGNSANLNHQVVIIGWDDNYPKENFPSDERRGTVQHDGAWYCMNSWGTNASGGKIDRNGCFWLSYEDGSRNSSFYGRSYKVSLPSDSDWNDHNYIGGNGGALGNGSYINGHRSYGIRYTAEGDNESECELVSAVGVQTGDRTWTIKAYKGNDSNGILMSEQTTKFGVDGFNTIKLANPFYVKKGESFYIELIPHYGSNGEPFALGYATPHKTYEISLTGLMTITGEDYQGTYKFNSTNGGLYGVSYIDGEIATDKQLLINVFTKDADSSNVSTITGKNVTKTYNYEQNYGRNDILDASDYFTFTPATNVPNTAYITGVSSDNEDVAVPGEHFSLKLKNAGTANVTITASDGTQGTAKIAVEPFKVVKSELPDIGTSVTDNWYQDRNYPLWLSSSTGTDETAAEYMYLKTLGYHLTRGTDYDVSFKNHTGYGEATWKITFKGNYKGSFEGKYLCYGHSWLNSGWYETLNYKNCFVGDTIDIMDYLDPKCLGMDAKGNRYGVTLSSSDGNVAKVNGTKIKIVGDGTAEITVTADDHVPNGEYDYATQVSFTLYCTDNGNGDSNNSSENGGDNGGNSGNNNENSGDNGGNAGNNNENGGSSEGNNSGGGANPIPNEQEESVPAEDPNTQVLGIESGEYKVEVKLPKSVPFTKSKKEVANYVKSKLVTVMLATGGGSCGITVKSVKATKPKNGVSKVTVKLKGSTKAEKRAVKAMNKRLKNLIIAVESE